VDSAGRDLRLASLFGDRVVLLAFVYRSCPDPNGCPLANFVLTQVRRALAAEAGLHENVRLVSLSIDPLRDTPDLMAGQKRALAREPVDWRFLTTRSVEALDPILEGWGQSVQRDVDTEGKPLGSLSHVLRVFLVDRDRRIRNIYTSSYLHAETVLADMRSLLMEDAARDGSTTVAARGAVRESAAATLGLPSRVLPATVDSKVAALGRKLFFDRRLSRNDTVSCAMCHIPRQGFSSNEVSTALGIEGRSLRRNAPTLLGVGTLSVLFHDGREDRLEQQIWGPLLAADEMGNPSVGYLLGRIRGLEDYRGRFEQAFAGRGPDMETLGAALAAYQRTLLAASSPFDRWYFGGDETAVGEDARRGFALFRGRAGCIRCHRMDEDGALFTDEEFHNTGVGYAQGARGPVPRFEAAPGVVVEVDPSAVPRVPTLDLGRYEITGDPADRWKFRTPGLRNVALTAPYMHDGSLPTLEAVVRFYRGGGVEAPGRDPLLAPLELDERDVTDLVAFLASLTGSRVDDLVAVGEAEPVGDRRAGPD
jgi:cytochrome c peroxidase